MDSSKRYLPAPRTARQAGGLRPSARSAYI